MADLYRSEDNKIIAGVCGGLGLYFDIDPTIIRIIFIIVTIFGGSGVLIYLILWLLIPTKSNLHSHTRDSIHQATEEIKDRFEKFGLDIRSGKHDDRRQTWGIFLLILGLLFLFSNFGLFAIFNIHDFWPIILILIGALIIFK